MPGHKIAKFPHRGFTRTPTVGALIGPETTLAQVAELQVLRDALRRKRIGLYLIVHTVSGVDRTNSDLAAYFQIPFTVEGHHGTPMLIQFGDLDLAFLDSEIPDGLTIEQILDDEARHELTALRRLVDLNLTVELFNGDEGLKEAGEMLADIFDGIRAERARQFEDDDEDDPDEGRYRGTGDVPHGFPTLTRPLTLEMKFDEIWSLQRRFKKIG